MRSQALGAPRAFRSPVHPGFWTRNEGPAWHRPGRASAISRLFTGRSQSLIIEVGHRMVRSLQMVKSIPSRAGCHAVGDRSFCRRVLVVLLSALLGWPEWGSSLSTKEPGSMRVPGGYQVGGLKTKSPRAFNRHPGVRGHQRPVNGVLDNDPAILVEDSEDWIEDRAGSVLIVVSDSAISAPVIGPKRLSSRKSAFLSQSGPFPGPARFRC